MKPQLLRITHEPVNSFSVRQDMMPNINSRWHYHPEVELIHFHKGAGAQFIGDSIKNFRAGEIVLLGSNLPHYWMYDEEYFDDNTSNFPFATVIHFNENFIGERFLHLPETRNIRTLLEKANRGVLFKPEQSKHISQSIENILQTDGLSRILSLIECLSACAEVSDANILSSQGFRYHFEDSDNRINNIYNYTLKNFKHKISLKEISEIVGFIPNSFCRYFKSRTGKTYNQFLLEIRVGYACKLLLDNNHSIKQICFESGFLNFSCFHKSFKNITGFTPQSYQKKYLKNSI